MPGKDHAMDFGAVPCSPSGAQPLESRLPIIDVHNDNFQSLWPSILLAIKNSSFIALDTELSGLGDRRFMFAKSIEERYKAISIAARSRSILSLGLSCFKLKKQEECHPTSPAKENQGQQEGKPEIVWNYMVQTFNITVLCHDDYTVETKSLQFLVDHGFDFNKQYSKGILYHRGNDKNHPEIKHPSVRDLFSELLMANVPVVFHNAFVDLIFLHHNLYCDLPFKLNSFLCNYSEMFPAGIYDTKFIVEYYMRMPASYLLYIFKRCLRQAVKSGPKNHLLLSFLDYPQSFQYVNHHDFGYHRPPTSLTYTELRALVCQRFADHGWCHNGRNCPKSHNMELVLDLEETKPTKTQRRKDRKRKLEEQQKSGEASEKAKACRTTNDGIEDIPADLNKQMGVRNDQSSDGQREPCSLVSSYEDDDSKDSLLTNEEDDDDSKASSLTNEDMESQPVINTESVKILSGDQEMGPQQSMSGSIDAGHTAGFDAFMTGYIFATAIAQISGAQVNDELKISGGRLPVWHNKVYLTGKEVPLAVAKSNFASFSNFHKEKHKRLRERTKV